ncbi:MAG TPA: hypothetical protein VER55_15105, partial [Ardenticatenaceae bacterium]|nr:hypothetical protein [Ardenticatenaceae bacterium]
MTTYTRDLVCRVCGARVPLGASYICDECFGPLEIAFDYEAIKRDVSKELIAAGPRTLWRYRQLLPDIGPP